VTSSRAEEYRCFARDCLAAAHRVENAVTRAVLLRWRKPGSGWPKNKTNRTSAVRLGTCQSPRFEPYVGWLTPYREASSRIGLSGFRKIVERNGLEHGACECYDIMRHEKLPHGLGLNV
jgi:hypothetical protein